MTTHAGIIAEARTWLGTPYHHQGRAKGVGCDCIGLVIGVGRALGLVAVDAGGYSRQPDGRSLRAGFERHAVALPLDRLQPGDVLMMRIRRDPQHVGILGPGGTLIHAHSGAGRVVEIPLDDRWRDRIVAAFAYPGLAD